MKFITLAKSTVQGKTQNFAVFDWIDRAGLFVYEIPLLEKDYVHHPDLAHVPLHSPGSCSLHSLQEMTVYHTAREATLDEIASYNQHHSPSHHSNTSSPPRSQWPSIRTPLLTHPFPETTSTNSQIIGYLETTWTTRTCSTPPPYISLDSRRQPVQSIYVDPAKLLVQDWVNTPSGNDDSTLPFDEVYHDYAIPLPRSPVHPVLPPAAPQPTPIPTYTWHHPHPTPSAAADLSGRESVITSNPNYYPFHYEPLGRSIQRHFLPHALRAEAPPFHQRAPVPISPVPLVPAAPRPASVTRMPSLPGQRISETQHEGNGVPRVPRPRPAKLSKRPIKGRVNEK